VIKEEIILKQTPLNNNCPECYATDGMELSFKQEEVKTKFWKQTKGTIIEHIYCRKCENEIYPGQWTEDIERVYNYHKKTVVAQPSSKKYTPLSYFLFVMALIEIALISIYFSKPELLGL